MMDRTKWLEGAREDTTRAQMAKVYDQLSQCQRQSRPVFTDFINPVVQDLCDYHFAASKDKDLPIMHFEGGHAGFESCVIGFYPPGETIELTPVPIALLEISALEETASWSHRDLLGSLLGLGISREKFGDLRVGENAAYVFVLEKLATFVINALARVSRDPVSVREVPWSEFPAEDAGGELLFRTVKTPRLDAVIAAGFDLSRSQAQKLVEAERVKVNHRPQNRPDKAIPEDAVISVRGYGRLVLVENMGTSKKDRTKMQLKRFR